MPIRDFLIGETVLMGKAMTPIAPIANAALNNKPIRIVMEKMIGVHRNAPMPTAGQRLLYWGALRAFLSPYFLRSTTRGSRVRNPAFFRSGR